MIYCSLDGLNYKTLKYQEYESNKNNLFVNINIKRRSVENFTELRFFYPFLSIYYSFM
ncbi:hypothetical protein MCERE19_03831 [Spirosomataceae bacterium]